MAQYEALRSFGGKVSASKGRTIEITDEKVAKDLLRAGYIKAVGGKTPAADKPKTHTVNRSAKTGKLVTKEEAQANPDTTVTETVETPAEAPAETPEAEAPAEAPAEATETETPAAAETTEPEQTPAK